MKQILVAPGYWHDQIDWEYETAHSIINLNLYEKIRLRFDLTIEIMSIHIILMYK